MGFFTWRTNKINNGFEYKILKVTSLNKPTKEGLYAKTEIVKQGVFPTRARAKGQAQRWVRYLKGAKKI